MNRQNLKLITLFMLLTLLVTYGLGQPNGATVTSNTTQTAPVTAAGSLSTAGGSFTILVLNASSQTPRWKAYVGNITGEVTLDDFNGQAIYDWDLAVITGEVFVSRNNSVNWTNIQCAPYAQLSTEDTFLNISSTKVDSINNTFNESVHMSFIVGGVNITQSSCPAIATYINSTEQASSTEADFQEIALYDGNNLVFSTILEVNAQSYDSSSLYDFQLIVPENEFLGTPTTYYFYAELG